MPFSHHSLFGPTATYFIGKPTPNSVPLLVWMLTIYPILQPILSYSHRADIIHLAWASRTLHSTIKAYVALIAKPFRSCTKGFKPCDICQAITCYQCRGRPLVREGPPSVMARLNIRKVIFISMHTRGPSFKFLNRVHRREMKGFLAGASHKGVQHTSVLHLGKYKQNWCESCLRANRHSIMWWARLWQAYVPTREWKDIPETHTTCTCTHKNRKQCVGDKHLVDIQDIPMGSQIAALVELPPSLRSDGNTQCAVYIDGAMVSKWGNSLTI